MYANGISVWRMVRPALIAAVGIALINFVLFDQIVPRSNIRFRALRSDVMQKSPTLALRPVLLNPLPPTSYILRAATIDASDGRMRDITIYDLSSNEGRRVLHADSGQMAESPNGSDLLLTLRDGVQLDIKSTEPGRIERTRFKENRIRIRGVANQLQRRDDQLERGDREMSGCQLLDGVTEQQWGLADLQRRREYATRRDLRHLAGLSPVPAPSAQLPPKFAPHCGKYRDLEEWFGQLMVPDAKQPTDSVPLTPDYLKQAAPAPAERGPPPARLPHASIAVNPPMPQPLPQPVPAPAIPPPPPSAATTPSTTTLVKAPRDSATPKDSGSKTASHDSTAAAILSAVVPPDQHTAGADSALALALRQRALNTPLPPAATSETTPLLDHPNPGFLVPPQGVGETTGPVGTIEEIRGISVAANRAISLIRQYQVEYHKKFSIPLASFCFVLLGVALALKYPRSGIGLVIAASLVIFMAFYILLIGGENVANKGYISPAAAMHGPVLLFTVLGLLGVIVANREMGTARTGGILDGLLAILRHPFRRNR